MRRLPLIEVYQRTIKSVDETVSFTFLGIAHGNKCKRLDEIRKPKD